ncbi:MAG: hypothetical protein IJK60_04990, partial [Clostridia bacterium]|nr:hypothetical protein [Clostridia bacterium]
MKTGKRLLSILLSVLLLFGTVAIGGVIGSADVFLPVPDITYGADYDGGPIVLSENKTIKLDGVTIEGTDEYSSPITIEPGVTVNIILSGENTLTAKSDKYSAGIYVKRDNSDPDNPVDAVLNIYGEEGGKLTVTGGNFGAAIGGVRTGGINTGIPGIINIYSGEIYAQGGADAAAIGAGRSSNGNEINIYGGDITALAGSSGAGIGTGYATSGGASDKAGSYSAGIINITGGTVRAAAGKFKDGFSFDDFDIDNTEYFFENCYEANGYGAGIGGGYGANGCTVTIGGDADVTAIGSCGGAGIGAGRGTYKDSNYDENCTPYDITIEGNAKVVAAAPDDTRNTLGGGAGIGGGRGFNDGGSIKILDNADVTAVASPYAAAIGGSWEVVRSVDIEDPSLIARPDTLEIAPTATVRAISDGFTDAIGYPVGSVIQYGTYPQSGVTDETTVAALNEKLTDDGWVSYGYYSGTNTWDDGQMTAGDWMKYQDVALDGVRYRAVTFDSYRPYVTGCTSSSNNQSSNGYSTGTTYWFKFEPIEWKVFDPDSGFIVCACAIDSQAYNNYIWNADGEYYGNDEKTYRANDYANSSIRTWLNNDFINTAFSSSQQENIKVTELNNSCPYDSNYDSETTSDKIFLLSYNEVTNSEYGFNSDAESSDTARQRSSSDYAKCQGIYKNSAGNSSWWLRSPVNNSHIACDVDNDGCADYYSIVNFTNYGVVPALKLQNLESDPTGVPVIVKPEMTVTVTPENPVSDGSFTLTVNLPDDAAGNVIIRFNEVDLLGYIQLANGNSQDFNCLQ